MSACQGDECELSFLEQLALAVAPTLAGLAWTAIRDDIERRRDEDSPCPHGRPGGRLCAACFDTNERLERLGGDL